jgi:hypothetical protein
VGHEMTCPAERLPTVEADRACHEFLRIRQPEGPPQDFKIIPKSTCAGSFKRLLGGAIAFRPGQVNEA